jgi:hypothetical protein
MMGKKEETVGTKTRKKERKKHEYEVGMRDRGQRISGRWSGRMARETKNCQKTGTVESGDAGYIALARPPLDAMTLVTK